jgi:ubiquinol-cytochrome c reductase cytochrome c subunit
MPDTPARVAGAALCVVAAFLIVGLGLLGGALRAARASTGGDPGRGRQLFVAGCASCHGMTAQGVSQRGPSLVGVGAQAADFYLTTGRMPLNAPGEQPHRAHPAYAPAQIRDLVAYIESLGGPPIPTADPGRGSLSHGRELFASSCAGCHQIGATGGVVPGASVPSLDSATPTQIAEAIRIGPFVMPRFSDAALDQHGVDSITRYVLAVRSHPDDRGGWSLGHLGPIPEGMVAWLIGIAALLVVARVVGERDP